MCCVVDVSWITVRHVRTSWPALAKVQDRTKELFQETPSLSPRWLLCLTNPRCQDSVAHHMCPSLTKGSDIPSSTSGFDNLFFHSPLIEVSSNNIENRHPASSGFDLDHEPARICPSPAETRVLTPLKPPHAIPQQSKPSTATQNHSNHGPPDPPQQRRPHQKNRNSPTRARTPRAPPHRPTTPSIPKNPPSLPPPNRRRARQHSPPLPPIHPRALDATLPSANERGQRLSGAQHRRQRQRQGLSSGRRRRARSGRLGERLPRNAHDDCAGFAEGAEGRGAAYAAVFGGFVVVGDGGECWESVCGLERQGSHSHQAEEGGQIYWVGGDGDAGGGDRG